VKTNKYRVTFEFLADTDDLAWGLVDQLSADIDKKAGRHLDITDVVKAVERWERFKREL
jgi:hypothetical protein